MSSIEVVARYQAIWTPLPYTEKGRLSTQPGWKATGHIRVRSE